MFKSEKQFAEFLKSQGKTYKPQPKTFRFNGTNYRPDFYCPEDDTYYEVKKTLSFGDTKRLLLFKKAFPNLKLKVVSPNGYPFYSSSSGRFFEELFRRIDLILSHDILTFPYEFYDEFIHHFHIWKTRQEVESNRRCFPCTQEKMLFIDKVKKELASD